jgi:hypothetical protein
LVLKFCEDARLARGNRSAAPKSADVAVICGIVAMSPFGDGTALARERSHSGSKSRFHVVDRHL